LTGQGFNKAIPIRHGEIVYHEEYAFLPLELDHAKLYRRNKNV
jgi:hypothetical protein